MKCYAWQGKRLVRLRKKHKLSRLELAKKLSVSYQTIANYETNRHTPSLPVVLRMCQVFSVDLAWFRMTSIKV